MQIHGSQVGQVYPEGKGCAVLSVVQMHGSQVSGENESEDLLSVVESHGSQVLKVGHVKSEGIVQGSHVLVAGEVEVLSKGGNVTSKKAIASSSVLSIA